MRYAGKHVCITGGSGDIGLAMARAFVDAGAEVTLLDRLESDEARAEVEAGRARFVALDVVDQAGVRSALDALPPIDVAIANAGVYRGAPFLDMQLADWKTQIDVNLSGVFVFCQAAAKLMAARGNGGAILITGTWVQNVPSVDGAGYCSSKAGAAMLGRCMALELGPLGIRVNLVAPGMVDAGMAKRQLRSDPAFARKAAAGIPLGRLQTAEQVAHAAVFLCSDEADSVTGATLLVDGGSSLFKYE